jgi:hypothetical protein
MHRFGLRLTIILLFVLVVVGGAGALKADSGCMYADNSYAVNQNGAGWCAGWAETTCMYCWDDQGNGGNGETCATVMVFNCLEYRY